MVLTLNEAVRQHSLRDFLHVQEHKKITKIQDKKEI